MKFEARAIHHKVTHFFSPTTKRVKQVCQSEIQSTITSDLNCIEVDELGGFYHLFQNSNVFFQTYGHQDNPLSTSAFE